MPPSGASVPPPPLWRTHPGVLGGMALLLAGNAFLPLFYGGPLIWALDYLGVFVLAFWTAALACRRARREGPAATFRLLGLGAVLGGLHYAPTAFRLPHAAQLGPALSLLGLLSLGTGLLLWPQQMRMPRDRMRTTLDGLAIALSLFLAAWVAMGSLDGVGRVPRGQLTVYALQVSACLGVLALWLLQEVRLEQLEPSRAKRFLRAALLALLAHSSLGVLLRIAGQYYPGYLGHAAEVLHQAATVLLALAALSPASPTQAGPAPERPSPLRALIPSAISLAVLLLSALHMLRPHAEPQRTLVILSLVLVGIMTLRHGLLILDLERLSAGLEARVKARTQELEAHHHEAMSGLRMRMMAGLAAGLAHDLNNILGIIRLRVDLLSEGASPAQAQDLKVLREASERAAAMTGRILASRIQEVTPTAFDFSAWMDDRASLFQALLRPGQRQEVLVAPDLHLFADPQSLDQVFQNLVTNARDAMGPAGTLTIRVEGGEGTVHVEVRDDGPGIAPEHAAHLFEPFFTTKPHGTGLGLATVRNLVVQNRGSIRVDSRPGLGTAFHLELPAPERLLLA